MRLRRMASLPLAIILPIALTMVLMGCSDRWVVVKQGGAAAYAAGVAVTPVSFEGTRIDSVSEDKLKAELGEEGLEQWQQAKTAFVEAFAAALQEHCKARSVQLASDGKGKASVLARVERVRVAEPVTVDHNPNFLRSELALRLLVSDAAGNVFDEIVIEHSVQAIASHTAADRFEDIAKVLADITAEYLEERLKDAASE